MIKSVLLEKIAEIKDEYGGILERYYAKKYAHECEDNKYKDSEDNIFCNLSATGLDRIISKEAILYRNSSLRYNEKLNIVKEIHSNTKSRIHMVGGRASQGLPQAKRQFGSEIYYLKDMVIRLEFYSEILTLLSALEEYENNQLQQGIELSSDCEYEAYLLNKCILMSRVEYCKNECTQLVKELNNRVGNSTFYSYDFYYILAELNFSLQKYTDAQQFLDTAIVLLKKKAEDPLIGDVIRYQIHDMLFAAYQLKALGYEFCGDYAKAIECLTGEKPEDVVKIFRMKLPDYSFDSLAYSSDVEGKYKTESEERRNNVIRLIEEIINQRLFPSEMAEYVYTETNQAFARKIVDYENRKLRERITNALSSRKENQHTIGSDLDKVYEANRIHAGDENLVYEFYHILAHCLNEYGITFMRQRKQSEKECEKRAKFEKEKQTNDILLLGRALMLYVSEKRSIYKSCYATTYAEAGDTWIAKSELWKMFNHKDYTNYDIATKAEIAFFLYIINSMYRIEKNKFSSDEDSNSSLNNRYLNYCYRSFDYDAIAHMRVYNFRNRIAEILQSEDLSTIAAAFARLSETQGNGKSEYQVFVDEVYFQNSNKRLRNEYEKVKYMYQFLRYFLQQYTVGGDEEIFLPPAIFDYAFKYIHYHNATANNVADNQIEYVKFEDTAKAPENLQKLIGSLSITGNSIESTYCKLVMLENREQIDQFTNDIARIAEEAERKILFVATESLNLLQDTGKSNDKISLEEKISDDSRFRLFSSFCEGLKEFFVFTVFFMIKDDFSNPNNIFIMTPIGTAIACRYRKSSDLEMLTGCFSSEKPLPFGTQREIGGQYRAVANDALKEEVTWESGLNDPRYAEFINHIISVVYDNPSKSFGKIKYRYKYHVSDKWKEAYMFASSEWKDMMEQYYAIRNHGAQQIPAHIEECNDNKCRVIMVDHSQSTQKHKKDRKEKNKSACQEITEVFSNISNNHHKKLLIWKGSAESLVGWRIVSISESCSPEIINEIRQIMCRKGRPLSIVKKQPQKRYYWLPPHDYKNSNRKFVFLSHYTREPYGNTVLKRELTDFFLQNDIPVWYDKEKLVGRDSWEERIKEVINHTSCAGIFVLVTDSNFFESPSIQSELKMAQEKKKDQGDSFCVLPIVYGIASNNTALENLIKTTISDQETELKIRNLIIPKKSKIITYLQPNQSLSEYTSNEINDGRTGSIITALKDLNII